MLVIEYLISTHFLLTTALLLYNTKKGASRDIISVCRAVQILFQSACVTHIHTHNAALVQGGGLKRKKYRERDNFLLFETRTHIHKHNLSVSLSLCLFPSLTHLTFFLVGDESLRFRLLGLDSNIPVAEGRSSSDFVCRRFMHNMYASIPRLSAVF